jgi:hypothetical protein
MARRHTLRVPEKRQENMHNGKASQGRRNRPSTRVWRSGQGDPEVIKWLAEHKARNGGKIRVSRGSTGVRVAFSKEADMALWQARSERGGKGKQPPPS